MYLCRNKHYTGLRGGSSFFEFTPLYGHYLIRTYGKSKIGALYWLMTKAKLTKEEAHRLLDPYYTKFGKNINSLSFFDKLKANARLTQEYK